MAVQAQKDMNWTKVLNGPNRNEALKALEKEQTSLQRTILHEIFPDDPDWEIALKTATNGRYLCDIKRNGDHKVRGVKQGFRENKVTADGADFNYYAHVAEVKAVRVVVLRPDRGSRKLALKDVNTAFLQSVSYPEGKVKFVKFKEYSCWIQ